MARQLIYITLNLLVLVSCQSNNDGNSTVETNNLQERFNTTEARLLHHFRNADSTMVYGNAMLTLALKTENSDYLGRAYNTKASAFEQLEQYDSAKHYYDLAQQPLTEAKDTANLALNYRGLGHIYLFQGAYDKALAQYQKTIDLLSGTDDMPSLSKSYSNIGMVLMESEMHTQAIDYYRKAIDIAENEKDTMLALPPLLNMSLSFLKQHQYDSAIFYAEDLKAKAAQIAMEFGIGKATYILAEAYRVKGDLSRADAEARQGVQIFTDLNAERDLSGLNYQRALVLHRMGKGREALSITDEMLDKNLLETLKVDVLELRANIYQSLGDNETALQAYTAFVKAYKALTMRESEQMIIQQQFKFDTEQKLQQIKDLQTDATITALRMDQQRTRLYIALASILVLVISTYLLFTRHKVRSRQEVMQLQNKLLRTQLNPHFLFNAMGAIQQYIYYQEDPQLISDYLGRFSRLTRMILNYSKQELITLEEELDFLQNYIALQQIRFEVPFVFNLQLDESLATDQLLVPPMLTQPFIENAIEHGFLHKEGQGHIDLTIEETTEQLLITVEDDGIGRTQAATLAKKNKHESLATKITIERLKLIQKKMKQKSELLIKDLMDQQNHVTGTRVQLNIPLIKDQRMIRAIIIDDEKPFINTLRATLQHAEDIMVVGEARSVSSGVTLVNETEPDLVFLDIQMSDGTGFDLLQKLERRDFRVIFITAHDHFAIEAFKFSAMDYILKPLISDELYRGIEKVRQSMDKDKINLQLSVLMDNLNQISRDKKRIILKEAETMHIIQLDEILWCEADGSYTIFYLTDKRKIMVSRHLKEFEDYLSPNGFFRAHRSHLVNLNKIRKFDRSDGGIIYLQENVALPISVRKKERLAEMLNSMQI